MTSGLGPQFDISDLGMQVSINDAKESEKLRRESSAREFDEVMERAKNGTATREELKRYSIRPIVESEKDSRGYAVLPKGGIFFPHVSKEVYDKYNTQR